MTAPSSNADVMAEDVRRRIRVMPLSKRMPKSYPPQWIILRHYANPDPNITAFRLYATDEMFFDVEDALMAIFPTLQPMTLGPPNFYSVSGDDRVLFALMETL